MLIDNTIELLRGNFPVPRHGGFSLRRRDSQHTEVTVSAEHTRDWHYSIISQHVNVALIMNVWKEEDEKLCAHWKNILQLACVDESRLIF